MEIAIRDSVTVSIALDTNGILTEMFLVTRAVVSTSLGTTSEIPGKRRTSSNVSPSNATLLVRSTMGPPWGESPRLVGDDFAHERDRAAQAIGYMNPSRWRISPARPANHNSRVRTKGRKPIKAVGVSRALEL